MEQDNAKQATLKDVNAKLRCGPWESERVDIASLCFCSLSCVSARAQTKR